ncbi:MAG: hypothetical protein A2854_03090 [Parcubacteria group bacterium RIFCSPHIGHO2_01_FULL_56_18]|nr:MAG: hypothetical protein A2854_03090 [Parcubacteria group bacterium RIFCSPHIGHO2_01_FULL_56_18]
MPLEAPRAEPPYKNEIIKKLLEGGKIGDLLPPGTEIRESELAHDFDKIPRQEVRVSLVSDRKKFIEHSRHGQRGRLTKKGNMRLYEVYGTEYSVARLDEIVIKVLNKDACVIKRLGPNFIDHQIISTSEAQEVMKIEMNAAKERINALQATLNELEQADRVLEQLIVSKSSREQ